MQYGIQVSKGCFLIGREPLQWNTNNTGRNTCADDNNLTQIEFHASVRPLQGNRTVSLSWGHFCRTVGWVRAGAHKHCQ